MTDEPVKVQISGVARPEPARTVEQEARDMLERAGVEDAQSMTGGDLVEIANLIADNRKLRADLVRLRSVGADLEAVEARVNAATAGPWRFNGLAESHIPDFRAVTTDAVEWNGSDSSANDVVLGSSEWLHADEADLLFMAHAREDVPRLLAEVRALRERVKDSPA